MINEGAGGDGGACAPAGPDPDAPSAARPSSCLGRGPVGRRRLWEGLVVLALASAPFSMTVPYELVWDDGPLVQLVQNRIDQGGLGALLTGDFIEAHGARSGYYRPLVLFTLWVDRTVAPRGGTHHLTNTVLHAINSLLVLALLRLLVGPGFASTAGAALFAVHPVHVESVAFVSGRTDLLAALFILAATVLWQRDRRGRAAAPGIERGLAFVMVGLAGLSKEIAFVFPGVVIAWEVIGHRRFTGGGHGTLRSSGTWVALSLGGIVTVLSLRRLVTGAWLGAAGGWFVHGPAVVAEVVASYLRLLWVPWPSQVFYADTALPSGPAWLIGAGMVLAGTVLPWLKGRSRTGALALAWLAVFLLPVSGIVETASSLVAERLVYLPSFAVCLWVAALLSVSEATPLWRPRARGLAAGALAIGLGLTVVRIPVWQNAVTLFAAAVQATPESWVMHYNLAVAYEEAGQTDRAIDAFGDVARVAPDKVYGFERRGLLRALAGRFEEALGDYREVVRFKPDDAETLRTLGYILTRTRRNAEAADVLERYVASRGTDVAALGLLEQTYVALHDTDGAVSAIDRALRLSPRDVSLVARKVQLLLRDERWPEVQQALTEAITVFPRDPRLLHDLGVVHLRQGHRQEARASFEHALRLDPRQGETLVELCVLAGQRGDRSALDRYLAALEALGPDHVARARARLARD